MVIKLYKTEHATTEARVTNNTDLQLLILLLLALSVRVERARRLQAGQPVHPLGEREHAGRLVGQPHVLGDAEVGDDLVLARRGRADLGPGQGDQVLDLEVVDHLERINESELQN